MTQEATKFDSGKPQFSLLPPSALKELVKVYTFGARKYGAFNYMNGKGFDYSRVFSALQRHLWDWWEGEGCDKESELSHLAHAAWNCLTLLQYEIEKHGVDNRPKPMQPK